VGLSWLMGLLGSQAFGQLGAPRATPHGESVAYP
jgi:hypothetical protein